MKFLDVITERKILWELRGLFPKLKKFLKNVDDDGNLITDEVESSPTDDTSESNTDDNSESNNSEDTEEPASNEENNNEEDNSEE